MIFIDTNIFLRFLMKDDKDKAANCYKLMEQLAQGKIKAQTTTLVIAEIVWVLQSPKNYNCSPTTIKNILSPILNMKGLMLSEKSIIQYALDIFVQEEIEFIDAYNAAFMEKSKISSIYSYDKHFDKFNSIKRIEP